MTPEQRQRASLAVRQRMNETRLTVPKLAARAGVDQSTVRALLDGSRWPRSSTRLRIARALGWKSDEIARRAEIAHEIRAFTSIEILAELMRRVRAGEVANTG